MAKWTLDADTSHGVIYWLAYWIILGGALTALLWWGSWLLGSTWPVLTALIVWGGATVLLAITTLLFSPFVITVCLVLGFVSILVLFIATLIHLL